MCFPVIRLQLDGGLKIFYRLSGLLQIIQNKPAVGISQRHFWVAFEGASVVGKGFAVLTIVRMHVAGDQGQIFIVGNNRLVLGSESESFVIAAEIIKIVG